MTDLLKVSRRLDALLDAPSPDVELIIATMQEAGDPADHSVLALDSSLFMLETAWAIVVRLAGTAKVAWPCWHNSHHAFLRCIEAPLRELHEMRGTVDYGLGLVGLPEAEFRSPEALRFLRSSVTHESVKLGLLLNLAAIIAEMRNVAAARDHSRWALRSDIWHLHSHLEAVAGYLGVTASNGRIPLNAVLTPQTCTDLETALRRAAIEFPEAIRRLDVTPRAPGQLEGAVIVLPFTAFAIAALQVLIAFSGMLNQDPAEDSVKQKYSTSIASFDRLTSPQIPSATPQSFSDLIVPGGDGFPTSLAHAEAIFALAWRDLEPLRLDAAGQAMLPIEIVAGQLVFLERPGALAFPKSGEAAALFKQDPWGAWAEYPSTGAMGIAPRVALDSRLADLVSIVRKDALDASAGTSAARFGKVVARAGAASAGAAATNLILSDIAPGASSTMTTLLGGFVGEAVSLLLDRDDRQQ